MSSVHPALGQVDEFEHFGVSLGKFHEIQLFRSKKNLEKRQRTTF